MASISTGPIVSDIRGKIGDVIYSRNRGGAYSKAYAAPVQPNTDLQIAAKAAFAAAITEWQGLSDQQRSQWNSYAQTSKYITSLGYKKRPSGYQVFVQRTVQANHLGSGGTAYPVDPGPFTDFIVEWATLSTTSMSLNYRFTPGRAGQAARVYYSPPVAASVMSPNSVRYVEMSAGSRTANSDGTTINFVNSYKNLWGLVNLTAGEKVFIKVFLFQTYNPDFSIDFDKRIFVRQQQSIFLSQIIAP